MEIGLILDAFGIKGEVRVLSLTDEPERFLTLKTLTITRPGNIQAIYEVEKVRIHKCHALVKLEGVSSRTEAQALKNSFVCSSGEELTAAEMSRVEREKLVGLEVITVAGDRLGVLEEVILTGANDVYEVCDGEKTVLLPAIKEVIVSVDLDAGQMVVDPLPGLL